MRDRTRSKWRLVPTAYFEGEPMNLEMIEHRSAEVFIIGESRVGIRKRHSPEQRPATEGH